MNEQENKVNLSVEQYKKEFARSGGVARINKLSKEQRSELGKIGAVASWKKRHELMAQGVKFKRKRRKKEEVQPSE